MEAEAEHRDAIDAQDGDACRAETTGPPRPCGTVLVVASDAGARRTLLAALARPGIELQEASDAREARARLEAGHIDLVIAERGLGESSGLALLESVRERWPATRRVLCAGAGDFALLHAALNRAGIAYFLPRPWDASALAGVLATLPAAPVAREVDPRFPEIVGRSPAVRELLELVSKVAETDSTALVTGETGTGKELVGRAIHAASRRRQRIFCAINSAAFPETLLESELFGHRRGAFTGATHNKKGLFEHAHRGTVFLDELAEMPLSMQAKLLRFLQTGEIRPVGDESVRRVDVRLVCATNKDLEDEVAAGRFREDLYYRLAVIPIHVPPLRERREDVPELARHFLARVVRRTGRSVEAIEPAAMERLLRHAWPGNVRELENVIERGVALCRGSRIALEDLPRRLRERPAPQPVPGVQSLPSLERQHILETLERVDWNRKRAAELLEISTTTLWRRLKEFGIDRDRAAATRAEGEARAQGL